MSSTESQHAVDRRTDLVKSAWERIRTHLENERSRVHEEIRNYPRPIPSCDQQFNYLLEERARISEELGRMDEASRESLARGDPIGPIDEFIESSSYVGGDAGRQVRSYLREGLSELET
jgi:hypothetical protein